MRKLIALLLPILLLAAGCNSSPPEEDLGDTYQMGIDHQYFFSPLYTTICESEDSYYWMRGGNSGYLYMKDKKTGETTALCNKPDCLHDKEADDSRESDCNAYYPTCQGIAYSQGKIYVLSSAGGEDINRKYAVIYEVDTSGSARKEFYRSEKQISTFIVHRGYLYLSFSDFVRDFEDYENNPELMEGCKCEVIRIRLDNPSQEPEVVWEETEKPCQINMMSAYGNQVYLQVTANDMPGFQVYDIQTKSISIPETEVGSFTVPVVNHHLLLFNVGESTSRKVYETDLKGNIEKEVSLSGTALVYGNEEYIICDNEMDVRYGRIESKDRAIQIYDKEYQLLKEFNLGNDMLPGIGMDEQYYFYLKSTGEEGYDIWAIDLTRLDEENLQGELFLPISSY